MSGGWRLAIERHQSEQNSEDAHPAGSACVVMGAHSLIVVEKQFSLLGSRAQLWLSDVAFLLEKASTAKKHSQEKAGQPNRLK